MKFLKQNKQTKKTWYNMLFLKIKMNYLKIVCHPIKNETGNDIIERAPADPHDCVSRSVSILISISDHLMFYDKATLVQL